MIIPIDKKHPIKIRKFYRNGQKQIFILVERPTPRTDDTIEKAYADYKKALAQSSGPRCPLEFRGPSTDY